MDYSSSNPFLTFMCFQCGEWMKSLNSLGLNTGSRIPYRVCDWPEVLTPLRLKWKHSIYYLWKISCEDEIILVMTQVSVPVMHPMLAPHPVFCLH